MVGGAHSPEGKGFAPSGSLLDQAHLLPSLGRGLCPEGGPRNNGEVDVDKPVPKLLPTSPSNQKGERVYWGLSCSCLSEGRVAPGLPPFTSSLLPIHLLGAGWRLAEILLALWLPLRGRRLEGQEQRSPGPRIYSNSCQNVWLFLKKSQFLG